MTEAPAGRALPLTGWWRRWPSWAGYAAAGCAALYGAALLAGALAGRLSVVGVPGSALPATALLLVGAVFAAATVRPWGRALPVRVVSAGVWTAAASALAGSCFVLLNLIELVLTGSVRDRGGDGDWSGFAERLCFAAVGALFAASAVSWRRRTASACTRCGRVHTRRTAGVERPAPQAAPRRVRWTAYAGCAAFAPYFTLHALGTLGGWAEVEDHYTDGPRPYMLLVLLLLIGLADFLLLGLVRPWGMVFPRWAPWLAGRRVPRFLPLAPVWLIAPTLALYGAGGMVLGILLDTGAVGSDPHWPSLGEAASLAFGGYGWALAIAAVSYQRRTRPRCAVSPASHQKS
ncbi:hypothetical protein [Actinomadura sp. K4S16]|uniref:hypothetical protein n=1 Tax=Actinomadura sp. K4S16 TaxID=1316147 RepID=UPI0011EF8D78|nr:hypothetical protein [Actinomadura sp. K4S16]